MRHLPFVLHLHSRFLVASALNQTVAKHARFASGGFLKYNRAVFEYHNNICEHSRERVFARSSAAHTTKPRQR